MIHPTCCGLYTTVNKPCQVGSSVLLEWQGRALLDGNLGDGQQTEKLLWATVAFRPNVGGDYDFVISLTDDPADRLANDRHRRTREVIHKRPLVADDLPTIKPCH